MSAVSTRIDVRAPADQEEGSRSQVLRWLKTVGERVAMDEPLIEIETDKVTVEIAAPAGGVLAETLKGDGEGIAPGELLARIEADDPAGAAGAGGAGAPSSAATSAPAAASEGTPRAAPESMPLSAAGAAEARAALAPAVRRLIAELGLDSAAIPGSGTGGRITVDDVLRVAGVRGGSEAPRTARAAQQMDSTPASSSGGGVPAGRRVPHSATRRRIAEHMVRSLLQTAPHVTTVFEADFSAVLAHRARHRDELAREGVSLTLTAYVLSACVEAIRAVPETNARWTDEALELLDPIHIGVATAVEDKGLIVPVVRHVEALDLRRTARELGRLTAAAREDRLAPGDVRGGTFTVSNHGVSGSVLATPIVINQPQVAILGVGKVERRPVVIGEAGAERIAARPRAYLTLTVDHRVMDGQRANRFMQVLVHRLEAWPAQ